MGHVLVSLVGDSTVTVSLQGEIDLAAAADLRGVLVEMILHYRPARILVDLREAGAVDATVIGALQAAHELACEAEVSVDVAFAVETLGEPRAMPSMRAR